MDNKDNNKNCRMCHYFKKVNEEQGYCNLKNIITYHKYADKIPCDNYVKYTNLYRNTYLDID